MPYSLADFRAPSVKLEDVDLPRVAADIGCGEDEVHAILEVETSGGAADRQGRLKQLFEPHVFYRCLPASKRAEAQRVFVNINGKSWAICYPGWRSGYPSDSYPRLMAALAIDETAALKACSWGLAQILGENHKAAGYPTPQAMVKDFTLDEDNHLEAMIRFIVANGMQRAIQRHDWAAFASRYNGPKYAVHNYHGRLAAAFGKWQKIKDTPWDRKAATLMIGTTAVDTQSGAAFGNVPIADVAAVALPSPGAKPTDKGDAQQLGIMATVGGVFTAGWQGFMGSGTIRVAAAVIIGSLIYWFLARPILRRMSALQGFYAQVDAVEASWLGRLRVALKGIKTVLWSRLLWLAGLALPALSILGEVNLSQFIPEFEVGGFTVSGDHLQWLVLAGIGVVTRKLRAATTTAEGSTDIALAPQLAPVMVTADEVAGGLVIEHEHHAAPAAPRRSRRRRAREAA